MASTHQNPANSGPDKKLQRLTCRCRILLLTVATLGKHVSGGRGTRSEAEPFGLVHPRRDTYISRRIWCVDTSAVGKLCPFPAFGPSWTLVLAESHAHGAVTV